MHALTVFLTYMLLVGSALTGVSVTTAKADHKIQLHIPAELRGDGSVPACDNARVLKKVTKRFRRNNIHHRDSDLEFDRLEQVRETDYVANPADQNDRRFCAAHVHLSDGTHPTVYYLIQERDGVASLGWGVDYCVSGHDIERAHGANCRSLREPF